MNKRQKRLIASATAYSRLSAKSAKAGDYRSANRYAAKAARLKSQAQS